MIGKACYTILSTTAPSRASHLSRLFGIALSLIACLGLSSCRDNFPIPAPNPNIFLPPTCNINHLRQIIDTATTLPLIITQQIVIQGVVTTSDSTGNIYKALYIEQDESGIEVKLNVYDLYRIHPLGSTVSVILQGMALDTAGTMLTLGPLNTWPLVNRHLEQQTIQQSFTPARMKLKDIDNQIVGQTIELCNVEFIRSDTTYSGSQKIRDIGGGKETLTLYSSPYCTFAQEPLPQGALDMRVLVSIYNNKLQLRLNSLDCVRPARDIVFRPETEVLQKGATFERRTVAAPTPPIAPQNVVNPPTPHTQHRNQ